MYFKRLAIGDTFDFINPGPGAIWTSFYARCTKVSVRCFTWKQEGRTLKGQIGSVYAPVYHVEKVSA
jgi:hypothetical protein